MTRLLIAWANFRYRLHLLHLRFYEATHEPDSRWLDEWADELHRINAETRRRGRLVRIDGQLCRRTWAGLIRVEAA